MKKRFLILILAMGVFMNGSFDTPRVPNAQASFAGGLSFPPAFVFGGFGTFAGGAALYLWGKHEAEKGNAKKSIVLRILGVLLIVTGAVLDEETADKELTYVDMKQDLAQKIEMGIYSETEAESILMDYVSKTENKPLEKIDLDIKHKTANELRDELVQKTGLESLTVGYLLASMGIQTN